MIREYPFTLPKGWLTPDGQLQRQGVMRLATGLDEFATQRHPKVLSNPYYASLVLLSRVVTQLGDRTKVSPEMLEELFIIDSVYLQQFYNQINQETGGTTNLSGE
ncbi:MAG: hypothetical protein F6J87_02885 [Spirulina sp. SIO3F2]|nr:hypothetical protein [Spirulina sp. SIO3F2]